MKVFMVFIVAIGCVSARGSGPYLPSGWRPDGPAFYLPSEVAKLEPNPLIELQFQETEASGSDALREYGPPKLEEVFLNVNQGLPDVTTEQVFFTEVKNVEVAAVEVAVNVEVNKQQVPAIEKEVSTIAEYEGSEIVKTEEELTTEICDAQTTAATETFDVVENLEENSDAVQSEEVIRQEEIVTPSVVVAEENIVSTVVSGESAVRTAVAEESVVPTIVSEEIVVPTAVSEENVVPIAVTEENLVPIAVSEENVVLLAQQELVQDAWPTGTAPATDAVVQEQEAVSTGVSEETVASLSLAAEKLVQDTPSIPASEVEVGAVTEDVSNFEEGLVNLDNEVKAPEVPDIDVSSIASDVNQASEGFLHNSPLGFAVYGPPRQEDLARLAVAEITSGNVLENNEIRRRRFSPKLRYTNNH